MRYLLLTVALVLTGCGGESEAAAPDRAFCADQVTDLEDVRVLTARLSEPDSQWGPGGPDQATETAGAGLTALTGYAPADEQLARVTDRAREAVQAFHDDLADDQTLEGDGQSADTAGAALKALADACG